MHRAVIIGGGVAGLVAAAVLREGFDVTVVERAPQCGGLLRSVMDAEGHRYDYGTHVLSQTGVAELDDILFGDLGESWNSLPVIKAGTYFAGKLGKDSDFLDIRALKNRERAERELLATEPFDYRDDEDLETHLLKRFGLTITRDVYAPSFRKRFGCALKDLRADNPFALRRVVAFTPDKTRELKASSQFWDDKIAFHSSAEGIGEKRHFYPKRGGIGLWIESFCRSLEAGGVRFMLGRAVEKAEVSGGRLKSLSLDGGQRLEADTLVWTVPPFLLQKALGLGSSAKPPVIRPVTLTHMLFDRPFPIDNHYVTVHDEDRRASRVTLYPNLRGNAGAANLTVEALGEDGAAEPEALAAELADMGMVDGKARLLSYMKDKLPVGFPTLTTEFLAGMDAQAQAARAACADLLLLGNAKARPFFMDAVMVESFHRCRELMGTAA